MKDSDELRFRFGRNWARFLRTFNEDRLQGAKISLQQMLGRETLAGASFLDIGSGSGLFSLAARGLGATVHSFDYDRDSVACTSELKARFYPNDSDWKVEQGSVLDTAFMQSLGTFDVVYSWGVLHHTGAMWRALENACIPTRERSNLFIAIYNDQRWVSHYWKWAKRSYNRNALLRAGVTVAHLPYPLAAVVIYRWLTGRLRRERGMSIWYDYVDWLGGHPFEVAKPEEITSFFRKRGFILNELRTCGGRNGCNEFVFERAAING